MTNGIGRVGWRNYVSPLPNPLWNGMLAYYTGDNTADDAKGTAHGTLTNGATYGTGKINGGFSFDGIDDTITLSNTVTKFSSSTPFTYNVWVKAVSRTGFIYMDANAGMAGTAIGFYGGTIAFYIGDVAGLFGSGIVIPLNTWTMVTITYNGIVNQSNNLLFYTNGTFVYGLNMSTEFNLPNASSNKQIGSGGWRSYFNGNIDELGIWGRALTATEVTELYSAGAGKQYVAPAYTTRTAAFATATGITDTTILNALNTFDTGLISNGLDTKMKALYPFVGGTSNTHKYNFMDARDVDAAFRLQFYGGMTHSSTGVLFGGVNGGAQTFFNPRSNQTISNLHLSYYARERYGSRPFYAADIATNAIYDPSGWVVLRATSGTNNKIFFATSESTNGFANPTDTSIGFAVGSRTSSSSIKIYKNNVLLGSVTGSNSDNYANSNLTINGGINAYSQAQCAFSSMGNGLTDAESTTFYTLVQALQTTLGRQV